MGVALAGTMVWTLKDSLFTPIYTAHIMDVPWFTFLPSLLMIVVTELFVALTAYGLTQVQMATTCFTLGELVIILAAIYVAFVSLFILSHDERRLIRSILFRKPIP